MTTTDDFRELAREVVAEAAPDELKEFDGIWSAGDSPAVSLADQPLGFGIELQPLALLIAPYVRKALVAFAETGFTAIGTQLGDKLASMLKESERKKVRPAFDAEVFETLRAKLEWSYAESGLSSSEVARVSDITARALVRNARLLTKLMAKS